MRTYLLWLVGIATLTSLVTAPISRPALAETGEWRELTTNGAPDAPSARFSTVVWDGQANRLLVFGGYDGANYLDDLWEYTSRGWSPVPGSINRPPKRFAAAAVWDSQANRLLLFGGSSGSYVRNDLWQYTARSGWQQLTGNGALTTPAPRHFAAAHWDSQANRLLVFGGYSYGGSTCPQSVTRTCEPSPRPEQYSVEGFHNDLWEYTDAGGWRLLSPDGTSNAPQPRSAHIAEWDTQANRLLVFGGTAGTTPLGDLWQYTSAEGWQLLANQDTAVSPAPRAYHAATWDNQGNRLLVFGGSNARGEYYNDTWSYSTAAGWRPVDSTEPGNVPAARHEVEAAWDSQANRMLIFGGWDGTHYRNDLWQYRLSGDR
ncbi:MAG: hypothetical protein HY329_16675 [Chloroflexi bacterium]|nr:hypothetical protein [Chloroflexota bacterium]